MKKKTPTEIAELSIYPLIKLLIDMGKTKECKDIIEGYLVDRNGVKLKRGDAVILCLDDSTDSHGAQSGQELTIKDIALNNLGEFTTEETGSWYVNGLEVVRKLTSDEQVYFDIKKDAVNEIDDVGE